MAKQTSLQTISQTPQPKYEEQVLEAKAALDNVINKSRAHLYKPIQIAEILFKHRNNEISNLNNLETYRTISRKWRDEICLPLLGRKCTSTARFQDNLFDDNAVPPSILYTLGEENKKNDGIVEAYIYKAFKTKYSQLNQALRYCTDTAADKFDVEHLINSFWNDPGLKRSIDKVYEIIVYALFSTLVDAMDLHVDVSISSGKIGILNEFNDFARNVMGIDVSQLSKRIGGRLFRVGVTNAADRGLDMYSNWGLAIQIKHLSLDVELAEGIVQSISSDRIVIVCKEAEKEVIKSLLTQIGWRARIQGIVTEKDLKNWYHKALTGTYHSLTSAKLLECLKEQLKLEFPSTNTLPAAIKNRNYDNITLVEPWNRES